MQCFWTIGGISIGFPIPIVLVYTRCNHYGFALFFFEVIDNELFFGFLAETRFELIQTDLDRAIMFQLSTDHWFASVVVLLFLCTQFSSWWCIKAVWSSAILLPRYFCWRSLSFFFLFIWSMFSFSNLVIFQLGRWIPRSQGKGGSGEGQLDQVTLRSFNLEHKKLMR